MNARRTIAAVALLVVSFLILPVIGDEGPRPEGPRDEGGPAAKGGRAPKQGWAKSKSMQKSEKIFAVYDKNDNDLVTFEEWLKMKEGAMTASRRRREKKWFDAADANGNGTLTVHEFHNWLNRKPRREGPRKGPADNPDRTSPEEG